MRFVDINSQTSKNTLNPELLKKVQNLLEEAIGISKAFRKVKYINMSFLSIQSQLSVSRLHSVYIQPRYKNKFYSALLVSHRECKSHTYLGHHPQTQSVHLAAQEKHNRLMGPVPMKSFKTIVSPNKSPFFLNKISLLTCFFVPLQIQIPKPKAATAEKKIIHAFLRTLISPRRTSGGRSCQ